MQNPRYYRLAPTLLTILLAGRVAHAAQSSAPAPPGATAACDELKHDPLPAWTDSPDHSKRLTDCGYEFRHDGDYARAERVFAAALGMAKRQADRSAEATALDGYGATLVTLGQPDRAEPLLQEGFAISEELGDRTVMAEVSTQLGHLRTMRARYDEARDFHLRSFTLWEAIGDRSGMAVALNNVGGTYQSVGDYVTAADYFQRSLTGLEATRRPAPQRHRDRQSRAPVAHSRRLPEGPRAVAARLRDPPRPPRQGRHRQKPDVVVGVLPRAGPLHGGAGFVAAKPRAVYRNRLRPRGRRNA